MSVLETIRLWLRALFRRGDVERDLDREMRAHLEMEIEQNLGKGLSPDEARRRALVVFGGVERHKESVRDERGIRWLDEWWSDARLAMRAFRKHPGFTATSVFTMAIGIGAATAVFSLANWILLRPVPGVSKSDELVTIGFYATQDSPTGISLPTLLDLARAAPDLVDLAGTAHTTVHFAAAGAAARRLTSETIAGEYFRTLGVRPQIGRLFQGDELTAASTAQIAVISDRLWRTEFAASTSVLGRSVRVNGADFTIVGVLAPSFLGIERVGDTDIWLPPQTYRVSRHNPSWDIGRRDLSAFMTSVGRLRPGASAASVERQMRVAMDRFALTYPEVADRYPAFPPHVTSGMGTSEFSRPFIERTLRMLALVVLVVLLISCANAANLLLFRGVHRRGEMAVRRALGASTGRLVRLHVTEGLLLGVFGGGVGMIAALALRFVLRDQAMPGFPNIDQLSTDRRVLFFAVALSLASGVLFAIVPAIFALRADFVAKLKEAARSDAGGGAARVRRGLVVLQIAASMTLVVTGVLFSRTLRALHHVDVGMDIEHTTAFIADADGQGYDRTRVRQFRDAIVREISSRPGISVVTLASNGPFSGVSAYVDLRPTGYTGKTWPVQAAQFAVAPNYFTTLSIPLIAGKTVPREDVSGDTIRRPYDVVISQSVARRLFGMENPIGRSIEHRLYRGVLTYRVVGVAGDVRVQRLRGDYEPVIYAPLGSERQSDAAMFIVKSSLRPVEVDRIIREGVATVDASVPVTRSYAITAGVARGIAVERLFATLVTTLATLTVALMAIGLYGVIAYLVAARTQEIGVRMALGATAAAVIRLVAIQSITLVAVGLVIGTVGSVAFSRLVASWLFGVTPLSVSSYLVAGGILLVLAAMAAIVPARSATAVNPVDALRHE